MKDFILYKVNSKLVQRDIYNNATDIFSDFEWREGDSDSQGEFVSGRNSDDVTMKIWLGELPLGITVSFRLSWEGDSNRGVKKDGIIEIMETLFIPAIGSIVSKSEAD